MSLSGRPSALSLDSYPWLTAGFVQGLEHPQLFMRGRGADPFQVVDIAPSVERDTVAESTKKITGIGPDRAAALLVRVDSMHHDERHMVWRSIVGLCRKPQAGEIRVAPAQRSLDPCEMLGAIVGRLGQ